jgi:hypothetical protein
VVAQTSTLNKREKCLGLQSADVRFTPESGHVQRTHPRLLWAKSGHRTTHSINWSARPTRLLGTLRPSALATFKLMINSIFVDSCTGKSAGFLPLRT